MIVEVEHQRHDVDLIKIDNDETKLYSRTTVLELYRGNIMTITLF